jgi:hypothetical protein
MLANLKIIYQYQFHAHPVHLFCSFFPSNFEDQWSLSLNLFRLAGNYIRSPYTISILYFFMWSYFLKIVSRFIGPRYSGDDFFLGSNLVSFNRTLVVPYEILKVNFHVNKILVSILVCPFFVDLSIIVEITIKLTNLIKYGIAYL